MPNDLKCQLERLTEINVLSAKTLLADTNLVIATQLAILATTKENINGAKGIVEMVVKANAGKHLDYLKANRKG